MRSLRAAFAAGRLALLERQGPLPYAAPGRCAVAQDAIASPADFGGAKLGRMLPERKG